MDDRFGTWGTQLNQAQALQALRLFRRTQALLEQVNQPLQSGQVQQSRLLPIAHRFTIALQQAHILRDARAESYALGELAALYEQTHQ